MTRCVQMLLSTDCDSLNALAIISKHGSLLDIVNMTMSDALRLFVIMQTCDSLGMIDCCYYLAV